MRVDRWIWTTWMAKSRTEAGEFCRAGKVAINRTAVKPSKMVKIGDEVTVTFPAGDKKYRVLKFLEKRGKREMADGCFEDLNPGYEQLAAEHRTAHAAQRRESQKTKFRYGDGRGSKKDRRDRDQFWG